MEPVGGVPAVVGLVSNTLTLFIRTQEAVVSISKATSQGRRLEGLVASEECRLRRTLQEILCDTLPSHEIWQLLQDGQSPKWKSPEVETAFRNTLGGSAYNGFTQRLQNSVDTLDALQVSISRLNPPTTDITSDSRGSNILRRRLQWILSRSKIEKQMEELRQRNHSLNVYVRNSAFHRSVQKRRRMDDDVLRSLLGIIEVIHQVAEARSQDRHDSAYLSGNEDAMSVMTDNNVPVPYEPEYSVEGAKLRYLDVTIQSDEDGTTSESPAPRWPLRALLDSGATHCIMSVPLATKLGLDPPDETDFREVTTLVPSDRPPKCWEAKVNLRWKDKEGERRRIKIRVHVVFESNLGKDLVLSQEFMDNHEEVWHAATQVPESDMQLNSTFIGRLKGDDKKKQAELLAEREKKNQARYKAESSKKQEAESKIEASDESEAGPSTKSDPGPSNTSSGSSQDK